MKRLLLLVIAFAGVISYGQETPAQYLKRYETLVKYVGPGGPGVETLLDNWYKVDSTDVTMLFARFSCFYTKSAKDTVISGTSRKYLGSKPVLTVRDTLGNPVYYFNATVFDDKLFTQALDNIDKAISYDNTRIDFRTQKINALLQYEKESPDIASSMILDLIAENYSKQPLWRTSEGSVGEGFFPDVIEGYCTMLYKTGSPVSYSAFKEISTVMMKREPGHSEFVDNMGTYELVVKGNANKARKYYNKALRINPDDDTARKNLSVIEKMQVKTKKK